MLKNERLLENNKLSKKVHKFSSESEKYWYQWRVGRTPMV